MPPAMDMSSLEKLAIRLASEGPVKTLASPRRVRILFQGAYVADSTSAKFVWEHAFYPQWYLPKAAFTGLTPVASIKDQNGNAIATRCSISVNQQSMEKVVAFDQTLQSKATELEGYVKVDFGEADKWFEEDSPIFVHPKDPFKRVDLVQSTRPIRVFVDGQKVAEAVTSVHLFETSLPARFYLPLTSIDPSVLRPSKHTTQCPYKGESEYYHVVVKGQQHDNIVWYYTRPTMECAAIAGLSCFYNEKVDIEMMEDGKWKKLDRPKTHFG